ncbi:winged helix-turn-helix domain-containing protein [Methylomarinum vadi]|uniref:winged helix-turn-helix domain-containing protein n=1 Tax=Methylomarinum vadi TaxID=438855 RepID=UPI000A06978D|nr:winged helix-turn-helix domain-containing protein [Methylomarinum vadi]
MKKPKTTTVKPSSEVRSKKDIVTETTQAKTNKPSAKPTASKKSQPAAGKSVKAAAPISIPERVGLTAGDIWHYLDKNGETSVSTLLKEISEEEKIIQRSIGWLAQEGKLTFASSGRTEIVALKS